MLKVFTSRVRVFVCLIAVLAIGTFQFLGIGIESVSANSTPQTLPFSQNWTNVGLITANDDWSGVAGIEGYLGQDITVATGVDPQTLLTTSGVVNDLDAIANQANPDTLTNGGVAEFDGIANPTIALQGSGTADAPYVIFYLNTTGASNINVAYNLRDIDGSADNAIQPVALQYRVGNTGNFTNIPAGFVADASNGPSSATLVTPVSVTLPAAANNQALVQVRVITANAVGSDEWIGVDDINITAAPAITPQHVIDFNGDGKSDFAVVRNTGGGPTGQITWFINPTGTGITYASAWGISGDFYVPVDYDGDNKTDIAVWRAGAPTVASFYILQSSNSTVRVEAFGQTGDDPSIVDDYDGDGKADLAVYRAGAAAGDKSYWFFRGSLSNPSGNVTYVQWGQNGDFVAPGDYDGDGKADFVIQRNNGGGQARFWMFQTTAGFNSIVFGTPTDVIVPGDYDGDGKTDLAIVRGSAGQYNWYVRPSSTGVISVAPYAVFGASATDFFAQGDYDGDGKTEPAIWRPSATGGASAFWVLGSTVGAFSVPFGQNGDYPVANYNRH